MASMEELAKHFGDDPGHWKAIGYLHDYEQYPDEHLKHTEQPLKEAGLEDAEIRAILAHGYGIVNSFRNKTLKDPIIGEYQRAYKRLYARERTGKITKEELETVLAECEDKCALISCIEDSHMLNVAEVPMYNQYKEFALRFKDNAINLFLPRIEINKNIREYIAEELGLILYKVLKTKFDEEFIQHELYRYIPDARKEELRTKQLFVKYFYQVILYQERKPGIYTKFDDHMRRVIILEFYKRIITAYLDKNK